MPNIVISVMPGEVEKAKKERDKFDLQKTYNKFKCTNNYIGYLGELVFSRWLKENKIDFEWIEFTKQGWNNPDFIINNKSIDLKTTTSDSMWIQQEKFDVYVYAQINKEQTLITIKGWLSKNDITTLKELKYCRVVERDSRKDYVFDVGIMRDMSTLIF